VALARLHGGEALGQVSLCLAGHPEPVVIRSNGATELAGTSGNLLGILPDEALTLTERPLSLGPGDTLVLYTDGVTEARDDSRLFGQGRLQATLAGLARANPEHIADAVQQAAASFSSGELRDDLAVLVARRVS
jgi:serine phosphatase RsbU (regulator of sigma subunit)